MQLPGLHEAVVTREKVQQYLLSNTHVFGAAKAAFFRRFGFRTDQWEQLATALRVHAESHPVATAEDTDFGTRYTVEGCLNTPDGRRPMVRAVWFVPQIGGPTHFVTAYPLRSPT